MKLALWLIAIFACLSNLATAEPYTPEIERFPPATSKPVSEWITDLKSDDAQSRENASYALDEIVEQLTRYDHPKLERFMADFGDEDYYRDAQVCPEQCQQWRSELQEQAPILTELFRTPTNVEDSESLHCVASSLAAAERNGSLLAEALQCLGQDESRDGAALFAAFRVTVFTMELDHSFFAFLRNLIPDDGQAWLDSRAREAEQLSACFRLNPDDPLFLVSMSWTISSRYSVMMCQVADRMFVELPVLLQELDNPTHPATLLIAMEVLSGCGDDGRPALKSLRGYLSDDRLVVRRTAAMTILMIERNPQQLDKLLPILEWGEKETQDYRESTIDLLKQDHESICVEGCWQPLCRLASENSSLRRLAFGQLLRGARNHLLLKMGIATDTIRFEPRRLSN